MTAAKLRAAAFDRHSTDHHPVCPTCAEVQKIGARWCHDCGVWLHHDGPTSALMHKRALDAARARPIDSLARMHAPILKTPPPSGEAAHPAEGTGS